jgi:2-C-methyl-D-erythritol 4-phosphate cytidylyltransferase
MEFCFFKSRKNEKKYPDTAAIIAAAGSGSRMRNVCDDKLFFEIEGLPVIAHTLKAYEQAETVTSIVVVARRSLVGEIYALARECGIKKLAAVVPGGESRAESVALGLAAVPEKAEFITVADGDRPFISPFIIDEVSRAAYNDGAAAACGEVTDTIKELNAEAKISKTIDRRRLVAMQTPQTFERKSYEEAVKRISAGLSAATDDCAVMESMGHNVTPVFSDKFNIKITSPEDLVIAKAIAELRKEKETL